MKLDTAKQNYDIAIRQLSNLQDRKEIWENRLAVAEQIQIKKVVDCEIEPTPKHFEARNKGDELINSIQEKIESYEIKIQDKKQVVDKAEQALIMSTNEDLILHKGK